MRYTKVVATGLALAMLFAMVVVLYSALKPEAPRANAGPSHSHADGAVSHREQIAHGEMIFAFDVSDERKLVGFADNVFVGRVVEQVGAEDVPLSIPEGAPPQPPRGLATQPRTQFSVEVLENIKGALSGRVTVSQDGGRVAEDNGALLLYNYDVLLRPGQTVLLVTRYDQKEGWHQVVAPSYGDRRIEGAQQRENLEAKFEKAKAEQIVPGIVSDIP